MCPESRAAPPEAGLQAAAEEFQSLVSVAERYRAELGALEEQRGMLRGLVEEYRAARDALDGLAKANPGDEVLVPLGGGNFVRATIPDPSIVITGLGARVHVEGAVAEAASRLEERIEGTESASTRLDQEAKRITTEVRAINERLQTIARDHPQLGA